MEHHHIYPGAGVDAAGGFPRGRIFKKREPLYPAAADTGNYNLADANHRRRHRAGNTNSGAIIAAANPDLFCLGGNCTRGCVIFHSAFGPENGFQNNFRFPVLLEYLRNNDNLAAVIR
jgi:hypothetical protein